MNSLRRSRKRWIYAGLAAYFVVVGLITITPAADSQSFASPVCLICGSHGLADAVLNVLLFAPLGAGLVASGTPLRYAVITAFVTSLTIELAQVAIPVRYANLGDVLWNSVGALLGILIIQILLLLS